MTKYRYDENGRLIRTERPNRTVELRAYDAAGRLTRLQDLRHPGIPLQQLRYTYNAIGQIVQETDKQYRYDKLKRLVHCAEPGIKRWYNYDTGGNLTEIGEESAEQAALQELSYGKDNRLQAYGDYPVEFDRSGNLLYMTDGKIMGAYIYDARNRLVQSTGGSSYSYDAENRRIRRSEGGKDTAFVWDPSHTLDGLDHMLMELDGEGQPVASYIYGHGLIGREGAAGNYRAYLYDARGSTTMLTDEAGEVTDRYTYGPYGEEERHEGKTKQPYRYNGRDGVITDASGLVYMRARYYHPLLKRFLNRDVVRGDLRDGQTFNRYAYVNGDPIRYIDPLGLCKVIIEKFKNLFNRNVKSGPYEKGEGTTFEGNIYRSVRSDFDPLEMNLYTINSNHRYTQPGTGGLYFSTGAKIVEAELGSYGIASMTGRTMHKFDVRITNVLDISDPKVREKLGIKLDDLLNDDYRTGIGTAVTHKIGEFAKQNEYNGILAPSARADGGLNVILFNIETIIGR